MKSGIYKILNIKTNKFYIGSASYIYKRWSRHKFLLKTDIHDNIHLQRAWNKYSGWNFEFLIIEYCSTDKLIEREQYYIDTLKPEYNIAKIAGSNLGIKYIIKSEIRKKGNNGKLKGIPKSEEHKRKLSESQIGRIFSDEYRRKISEKAKLRKGHKRGKYKPRKAPLVVNIRGAFCIKRNIK